MLNKEMLAFNVMPYAVLNLIVGVIRPNNNGLQVGFSRRFNFGDATNAGYMIDGIYHRIESLISDDTKSETYMQLSFDKQIPNISTIEITRLDTLNSITLTWNPSRKCYLCNNIFFNVADLRKTIQIIIDPSPTPFL